jgi:hypothetical protein
VPPTAHAPRVRCSCPLHLLLPRIGGRCEGQAASIEAEDGTCPGAADRHGQASQGDSGRQGPESPQGVTAQLLGQQPAASSPTREIERENGHVSAR